MWHQRFPGASLGSSWIDLEKPTIATKAARDLTEALSVVVSSKAVCRLRPIRCAMPSIVSRWLVLASRVYSGPIRYTRPDHRFRTEAFRLSTLRAPVRSLVRMPPRWSSGEQGFTGAQNMAGAKRRCRSLEASRPSNTVGAYDAQVSN